MTRGLNDIITANIKRAIRAAGDPSLYRIGADMAEVMERPPGIGMDKFGPDINADTVRKHVERALAGIQIWRIDYLEAVAGVLSDEVKDLLKPYKKRR